MPPSHCYHASLSHHSEALCSQCNWAGERHVLAAGTSRDESHREQLSAQILCCADIVAWLSVLRIVTSVWCCLLFHWSDARLGRGHMVNFAWRCQSRTALLSFCVPWEGSALAEGQLGTETLEKISSEEDPKSLAYFEKWCIHVPTLSQSRWMYG